MRMQIAGVMIAAALAACSSGADKPKNLAAAGAQNEGRLLSALNASSLPAGSCGMILWTLDAERPIPVFRATANKGGEISLDGATRKLELTGTSGAAAFGVFEEQTFAADGISATVKVTFGLGFDGGAYLERGLISIERPDGWRTVVPAAGVAGCRSK